MCWLVLYWLIDVSIAVSNDHFLFALDAMFDVMVLYDWVARIPIVGFWLMDWWLITSCIRVQPQCSSISRALTLPLNGKLSLLSQFHIASTLLLQRGSSRWTCWTGTPTLRHSKSHQDLALRVYARRLYFHIKHSYMQPGHSNHDILGPTL